MAERETAAERTRRLAAASAEDVLAELGAPAGGLGDAAVERSRALHGANDAAPARRDTLAACLRRAFANPFSVTVLVIAVVSIAVDAALPERLGRSAATAGIMLAMVAVSGAVRLTQELRARERAARLQRLVDARVQALRAGAWVGLPASELVAGDRVRLAAGDRVPADLRILRARDLFVSQAPLTGESAVREKTAEPPVRPPARAEDCPDIAFAGSTVVGGTGEGVAVAVGARTLYGTAAPARGPHADGFDAGARSIAGVLVRFMAVLVPLVFAACGATKGAWPEALLFALSVAVGLTPELLPMVASACLARGGQRMGRARTVVKDVNAMQGFGGMDVLCMDKTGTLTGDEAVLEYYLDPLGRESGRVLDLAWLNSAHATGVANHIDRAVLRAREMPGRGAHFAELAAACSKVDELPFDHETRMASVLVARDPADARAEEEGTGSKADVEVAAALGGSAAVEIVAVEAAGVGAITAPADGADSGPRPAAPGAAEPGPAAEADPAPLLVVKGAVDDVVARCRWVACDGELVEMGADAAASVRAVAGEMLEDGMKVLAVATRRLPAPPAAAPGTAPDAAPALAPDDLTDLVLEGYLAFFDAPKPSARPAVARLRELAVEPKVLTGDARDVAASVCRRLDLPADCVLTGAELDALPENDVPVTVERCSVFAELTPRQKARVVEVLQGNGHTVGFLGDGMNDLPAVVRADVGISVDTAVEAVREAASVILLEKDLGVLEDGILEGRRAFANMSKYIRTTASSNFGNICSIVVASAALPFLPMTSVQLLLLNLLYDLLCLVLPWDRVDGSALARPLTWSGRALPRFMLTFGPVSSAFDLVTFAFLFFALCPALAGGPYAALSAAGQARFAALFQTGWFLESMWTQVLILHLLRTERLPFVQSRPAPAVLAVTVAGTAALTALAMLPVGAVVGLAPLPPAYFAFLLVVVALYLAAVTLVKARYVARHRGLG